MILFAMIVALAFTYEVVQQQMPVLQTAIRFAASLALYYATEHYLASQKVAVICPICRRTIYWFRYGGDRWGLEFVCQDNVQHRLRVLQPSRYQLMQQKMQIELLGMAPEDVAIPAQIVR